MPKAPKLPPQPTPARAPTTAAARISAISAQPNFSGVASSSRGALAARTQRRTLIGGPVA